MKKARFWAGFILAVVLAFGVWGALTCPHSPFVKAKGQTIDLSKLETKTIAVGDVTLGYKILGEGQPLLMIMAYGGAMDIWPPELISELAKTRKLILFDNRGAGSSSANDKPFSMQLFAQDALGLMDALKIEKADLLGWSMGSLIAQEMALAKPEKVGKLVLFGSALNNADIMKALGGMDKMTPETFVAQLFPAAWAEKNPEMIKSLPMLAKPIDPAIVKRQRKALEEWRGTASQLAKLDKDVLLIVGEADQITPAAQSLAMAQKIKGAWVARFKAAAHWLMYQNPKDFAQTVQAFLEIKQDLAR